MRFYKKQKLFHFLVLYYNLLKNFLMELIWLVEYILFLLLHQSL